MKIKYGKRLFSLTQFTIVIVPDTYGSTSMYYNIVI